MKYKKLFLTKKHLNEYILDFSWLNQINDSHNYRIVWFPKDFSQELN